jgi:hypothetical protein
MTKRLCLLMLVVAVSAAFVAGCGGSSSSSSSNAASPATSTPTAATSETATSTTSSGASSSLASNPTIAAAVAQCKQAIGAAPTLSSDAKAKLTTLCDKAASGDEASVMKAAHQVCVQIVKETVPQSAQQTALAACQKA